MFTTMTGAASGRKRALWLVTGLVAVAAGFALGAYGDWVWWPVYSGIVLTIGIIALLLVSAIVALAGRGVVRRIGLVGLALGIGLVAGQNLGPTREPLIQTQGGTMTLRLETPVEAVATGSAACTNVGTETEFAVDGGMALRLESLNRVLDGVYVNIGDRWDAIDDAPRKNGVRLGVTATEWRIPDDGVPSTVVMEADASSTIESTFSSDGGSIRFAGLVARIVTGTSNEPLDLAGTIEWTCGEIVQES
jgi:hypothetical protein